MPVRAYLGEKNPPCAPPLKWWVVASFVVNVANEATITFRRLEGLTTLVSQQHEGILMLASTYASWFSASQIAGQETVNALDLESNVLSADKKFSIKLSDVEDVLADHGSFVIAAIEDIGADEMAAVVKRIATCCVELVARLASIVAERDPRNDAADFMPPFLPHHLVKLRGRDFADIIRQQRDRLVVRWANKVSRSLSRSFKIFELIMSVSPL